MTDDYTRYGASAAWHDHYQQAQNEWRRARHHLLWTGIPVALAGLALTFLSFLDHDSGALVIAMLGYGWALYLGTTCLTARQSLERLAVRPIPDTVEELLGSNWPGED